MIIFGDLTQLVIFMLVPSLLLMLGFAPVYVAIILIRRRLGFRRSPLTRDLLRPPGHSLQLEIERLWVQLTSLLILALIVPFIGAIFYLWFERMEAKSFGIQLAPASLALGTIYVLIFLKVYRTVKDMSYKRHGMDGELAVAEELNLLMLEGCRVFHDVPIERGNVDHVVVSRSGVYAVETKSIGRLDEMSSDAQVTVDHLKNQIRLPDRVYPIPDRQLATQMFMLSNLLTSAVGKTIQVESILAIPGWFIKERIGKGKYYVINPRKSQKFFVQERVLFDDQTIRQIAHQLDQVCRDVARLDPITKSWNRS